MYNRYHAVFRWSRSSQFPAGGFHFYSAGRCIIIIILPMHRCYVTILQTSSYDRVSGCPSGPKWVTVAKTKQLNDIILENYIMARIAKTVYEMHDANKMDLQTPSVVLFAWLIVMLFVAFEQNRIQFLMKPRKTREK